MESKEVVMQEVLRDEVREYHDSLICDLISVLNGGNSEEERKFLYKTMDAIHATGNYELINNAHRLLELV